MIYLASPFTHENFLIETQRFEEAEFFTTYWLRQGKMIFSPIVYCYPLAKRRGLPGDFPFWRDFNLAMLSRATELWVLRLPGWDQSVGVTAEIKAAQSFNIPVSYHDPI